MSEVILTGLADEGPVSKRAEEQLTMCRALGLSYYSLRFVDLGEGVKNVMQLTDGEVRRLQQLHADFELRVSSIASPIGKVKLLDVEDGTNNRYVPFERYLKEEVARAIALAHAFEAKLIRGFSFYPPRHDEPEQHLSRAAEQLRAIAEACGKAGIFYGLEVEANLVGQTGELERELFDRVSHPNLGLVFDGANIVCQGYSAAETFAQYEAMRPGLLWAHIKDYRIPDGAARQRGHVDENALVHFCPADRGSADHRRLLGDLRAHLPALNETLQARGVPGFFLDLEPHVKGGGQFGGFSGPDGFGVALRALCRVLDEVEIRYHLTQFEELKRPH
jgi:sugar phosphate isomerase/epimerase